MHIIISLIYHGDNSLILVVDVQVQRNHIISTPATLLQHADSTLNVY